MLLDLMMHHPEALTRLVRGTPRSVWLLLAGLLAWGIAQRRPRSVSLRRSVALPLGMAALGAWGVVTVARPAGMVWLPLALWLAAAAISAGLLWLRRPRAAAGTRYDPVLRRFDLPGSMTPLLLILALFSLKYAVGLESALNAHPGTGFVLAVAIAYGLGTGCFLVRALRLWRLTLEQRAQPAAVPLRDAPLPLRREAH